MRWVLAVVLGLIEGGLILFTLPLLPVINAGQRPGLIGLWAVSLAAVTLVGLRYSPGMKGRVVFIALSLVAPALALLFVAFVVSLQVD